MCNVGGGGGEAAAHGKSEIDERKMEEGIRPWFFVTTYGERLLLLRQKMELVLTYEAFYAR
jgi:hypothetical protein